MPRSINKSTTKILKAPYLTDDLVSEIRQLEAQSSKYDHISFKFELDYKLADAKEKRNQGIVTGNNEFFCYDGERLIGYVGICDFGGEEPEASGVVDPKYRRQGIFTQLVEAMEKELSKRNKKRYLLLMDERSQSGLEWVKTRSKQKSHTEYEMVLNETTHVDIYKNDLELILASNSDIDSIVELDQTFGNNLAETNSEFMPEEQIKRGMEIYLVKYARQTIGKINLQFQGNEAWIFGFVIRPEYRGKHLGEAALRYAIDLMRLRNMRAVYLQVDSGNPVALALYRKVGFTYLYAMSYYTVDII